MDELQLQRIASLGWRADIAEECGPWLLRSNSGFTNRANSALPLTADVERLVAFLPDVYDFYGRHGLPIRFQVPLDAGELLDERLSRLGFIAESRTRVFVSRTTDTVAANTFIGLEMGISVECPPEWLDACERLARPLGSVGRALVARHPRAGFAEVRNPDGDIVAPGRVVVDSGWVGLSTAAVRPDYRRKGLGLAVIRARLGWAAQIYGARNAY